jgi:hypothetical protein
MNETAKVTAVWSSSCTGPESWPKLMRAYESRPETLDESGVGKRARPFSPSRSDGRLSIPSSLAPSRLMSVAGLTPPKVHSETPYQGSAGFSVRVFQALSSAETISQMIERTFNAVSVCLSGAANPSAAAELSTDCYFPVYPVKAFYATTKLHAMRTGPRLTVLNRLRLPMISRPQIPSTSSRSTTYLRLQRRTASRSCWMRSRLRAD